MERRRHHRVVVKGRGKLFWTEGRITRTELVEVENVAGEGVQIRMRIPLRVPQMVLLAGERLECQALVRYCRRDGTGWTAGLQLAMAASSTLTAKYGF